MKKNKTRSIFFCVACNSFRIVFVASHIKKTQGSTVKFPRSMQCSNVALHAHENVAPWPQGLNTIAVRVVKATQTKISLSFTV